MQPRDNWIHQQLRRSESFFKTDMVYLAKGGFWLTLAQVVTAASSLLLAIGFAHFLSKESYGTYKYVMSVGGILAAFSMTGLNTVVTKATARNKDGTLAFAFRKNLEWGLLTLTLFIGTAVYYFIHGNTLLAVSLLIIGIITPLLGSAALSEALLIGKKDFKNSSLTSGFALVTTNLITLAATILTGSVVVLVSVYMISSLLLEIAVYIYATRKYPPQNSEVDSDTSSYGAHLSVIGILNVFVDKIDSVLTFHFLGPAELAIYSFAVAIPEQLKGVAKNASSLALPKFSESDPDAVRNSVYRKMLIMGLVISLFILLYVVFAPFLFQIFFPQYKEKSLFLSQIYAMSLIAAINILPVTYLQAIAAKKELYLYNYLSGVLQIVLITAGVIWYGLLGLIVGLSLSRLFLFLY
jgi:O-antigen/teichoic acid export membrane protein